MPTPSEDQVDRLANVERYRAEKGDGGVFVVFDDEWAGGAAWIIAECGDRANAEKIARALNQHRGAVFVEDVERILAETSRYFSGDHVNAGRVVGEVQKRLRTHTGGGKR